MRIKPDRSVLVTQAWWAMGSLWLALVTWAFLNGPRVEAAAVQRTQAEAELENQDACQRMNMPFGADSYGLCACELNEVRRKQTQRIRQEANDLF